MSCTGAMTASQRSTATCTTSEPKKVSHKISLVQVKGRNGMEAPAVAHSGDSMGRSLEFECTRRWHSLLCR